MGRGKEKNLLGDTGSLSNFLSNSNVVLILQLVLMIWLVQLIIILRYLKSKLMRDTLNRKVNKFQVTIGVLHPNKRLAYFVVCRKIINTL